MSEPASATLKPWPKAAAAAFLAFLVVLQGAMWLYGFYALFQNQLETAGLWLTWALAALLLGGWVWRWLVAMGRIGARPTPRFGGVGSD